MKRIVNAVLGVAVGVALVALALTSDQLRDDIVNSNRKSVVKLVNMAQTSGGTGFFVQTPSGRIMTLTNGHVCRLAQDGAIVAVMEEDIEILYVEAVYQDNDLCLLTAPEKVSALKIAKSVRNTENVFVIGHPLLQPKTLVKGQISGAMTIEVLQGFDISCEGKTFTKIPIDPFMGLLLGGATYACIRTTEATIATTFILPGNSGSPVLNLFGRVVGVVYAGSEASGRGFLVPLEQIKDFLKDK